MRRIYLAVSLLAAAAAAADETFQKLWNDPAKNKEVRYGLSLAREYYKVAKEMEKAGPRLVERRDAALRAFLDWLARSRETLGVDLRARPGAFLEFFDRGRVDFLPTPKKGQLDYVDADERAGRDFGYCALVPKGYQQQNDGRYPLVLTLHGRVINPKHPAFGGNMDRFRERGRAPVFDYWLKSPLANGVLVLAPTGRPTGFEFDVDKEWHKDVQTLYQTLGQAMENYRVDWNRVFVELHGSAMRFACEHPFPFAGFIVRDGAIPEREWVMLENLNGVPLCYVADPRKWERFGKPFTEAISKRYAALGVPDNLVVLQGAEDANGALKGAGEEQTLAAFVAAHRRPAARKKL
ncbi:MAG: hypothetical protein ACREID_04185, partial [Planctomycetota bacterium]